MFATDGFAAGETITHFAGARLPARKLPRRRLGRADRYLQIASDTYLGPSGEIDDLINHSCAPNAGLRFLDDEVVLIALRDIAPGEEVAWDYSTTLADPSWAMTCACGAPECRGVVRAFDTLPVDRQDWYRARAISSRRISGDARYRAERFAPPD